MNISKSSAKTRVNSKDKKESNLDTLADTAKGYDEEQKELVAMYDEKLTTSRNIQIILSVALVIIIALSTYIAYFQYNLNTDLGKKYDNLDAKYQDLITNPDKAAQQEVEALVKTVASLINVPTDENPTVATVQDKEALKGQAFFSNAENGDKVIIYSNAKKAILYRPSANKIIEVAPLSLDSNVTDSYAVKPDPTSVSE